MKIIVFADIHGNQYTFKKFLNEINKNDYDYVLFLGDIMGYYYGQSYIIKKMMDMDDKLISVLGNHDYQYLNLENSDLKLLTEKYGRSYELYKGCNEIVDYLKRINTIESLVIDGKNIILMHGNFSSNLEGRIYPSNKEIIKEVEGIDYVFFAHTHYRMDEVRGQTHWINPGSLGQPRDGKKPSYCIVDLSCKKVEYISIEYDKSDLIREIDKNDSNNLYLKKILYRERT